MRHRPPIPSPPYTCLGTSFGIRPCWRMPPGFLAEACLAHSGSQLRAPDKLPCRVASGVDVKHVKVWRTSLPGILDLKLHLSFLHSAIAYRTRSTDSGSTPQPVRWAIGELTLLDSLAGLVAE